jgi:hypothetical protein
MSALMNIRMRLRTLAAGLSPLGRRRRLQAAAVAAPQTRRTNARRKSMHITIKAVITTRTLHR